MTTSKATNPISGNATHTVSLQRRIRAHKKQQEKETALYKATHKKLSRAYAALMELVDQLTKIKVHGTKKATTLLQRIKNGRTENVRLTAVRNETQARIDVLNRELADLGIQLALVREQEINETKNIDDIVLQVFGLNRTVVEASLAREECLKRHVFPRLIDKNGDQVRQITFPSSDGLRKVVAMVNTMTIIRGDLAREAKDEIQSFFDQFQVRAKLDPNVEALFELIRQLLIEKTDFKVGPDLYRFLAMELDSNIFPQLARAQTLLRQSIRSEKTNSYIRIYERTSRNDKWEVVPQS